MSLLKILRRQPKPAPAPAIERCQVDESFYDDDPILHMIYLAGLSDCHEPAVYHCYVCKARLCKDCANESLYKNNAYVCPKHTEL
jgi:hypothetical protein